MMHIRHEQDEQEYEFQGRNRQRQTRFVRELERRKPRAPRHQEEQDS